jgi:sulfite dehydrogenase (quinone) subunit SoeC
MHPAYSVIFFTTVSGAGYGLWIWLGLRTLLEGLPDRAAPSVTALVLGGVLVTLGLLSSTFHLGHPERAWRAFSQWRSSWLSREGVAALATYLPAGALFLAFLLPGALPGAGLFAALLVLGALVTLWCTGMIYASLRTVPEWNHGLVPAIYLVLAAATGALLLATIDAAFGQPSQTLLLVAAASLLAGALMKWTYWQRIDGAPAPYTLEQAIGIPGASGIRPLDPPHTQPNFVMREMGYAIGRRHAGRLRRWTMWLLFALPLVALVIAALVPVLSLIALPLALLSAGAGVLVERWLFFAEARHVSMLYYGAALGGREAAAP